MERTAVDPPARTSGVLALVEAAIGPHLAETERLLNDELQSANPYVRDILQHVTRFRGKRLRPILVLLSAEACGGINRDHHLLAAVVELIHLATLIHDDVLDEADTRRHVATVNARWNNETSVLFGDFLFSHAFQLAASLASPEACRAISRSTNLICEGELSQIKERGNLELSEETYFRIIDGKTAELCAVCGILGARYAQAEPALLQAIEQYCRLLGLAFQIADDVLDLTGNEQRTGKSLGSDIAKQKLTLPLIRLLATTEEPVATEIRQLLAHPDEETRAKLAPYLDRSDALQYSLNRALSLAEEARRQLDIFPDCQAVRILSEIAEFAVQRQF